MAAGRNYQRKGDPFTGRVRRGEGPPAVRSWRRPGTGREWFTRVPVHLCQRLDAVTVGASLREHGGALAAHVGEPCELPRLALLLAFDWDTAGRTLTATPAAQPLTPGAAVRLRAQTSSTGPGGAGVRMWLTCPRCSRRCGVLYASPWGAAGERLTIPLAGCRECLGLTDESRQRHKCPDWAGALLGARPYKEGRRGVYHARTWGAARERALYHMQAGCARALPAFFDRPARPERWGLGPCPWGRGTGGSAGGQGEHLGGAEGVRVPTGSGWETLGG